MLQIHTLSFSLCKTACLPVLDQESNQIAADMGFVLALTWINIDLMISSLRIFAASGRLLITTLKDD